LLHADSIAVLHKHISGLTSLAILVDLDSIGVFPLAHGLYWILGRLGLVCLVSLTALDLSPTKEKRTNLSQLV
jgi:hypothetical protein